ncbi:hypothetical protein [Kineosporia succinea]|uniref:DUF2180 family protein n=1 Tax=Kineosporia succinea TaxID=84632 RepID=A0ABT9P913_9ACTN|nr:hypothetical protein [Kineosporia succinea]MDP9828947.1 hypothetical protein [Kineosporia succinea]
MHCLDCALDTNSATPAVACCSYCGGAVCLDHAAVMRAAAGPIGMRPAEPGRRVVSCLNCTPTAKRGPRTNILVLQQKSAEMQDA